MFIEASFIISKTHKKPGYPSVGKQINCGTFQTMEYYSTLKKKMSYQKKWRKLECILLSEKGKATYCMILNTRDSRKKQNYEDNKNIHGCRQGGEKLIGRTQRIFRI